MKKLRFTQKQLEDETKVIKKDIDILQKNLNEIEKDLLDPQDITNKLIQLENRSRRNNLCFSRKIIHKMWWRSYSPAQNIWNKMD